MTATDTERPVPATGSPLLSLRGIEKSFGAVHVLHGVDFDIHPGKVTALVGDNGAGKSTLIKGIAGIHAFDKGEYFFEGKPVTVHSPRDANALGIEVVYQDLALCDNLDVVHNMFLGREQKKLGLLDESTMETRARTTLDGLSVRTLQSVRTPVASLSGGQRQTVAIARAVLWNSKVVILDEPTAALGVAQTEQVLALVRRLADHGLGVALISHNLNDVFQVADEIAVLYLGNLVETGRDQGRHLEPGGRADHHRPGHRSVELTRATNGADAVSTTIEQPEEPGPARPAAPTSSAGSATASTTTSPGSRAATSARCPRWPRLIVLVIVFTILTGSKFTNAFNFSNLILQGSAIAIFGMGLVFALLIGEIDLSAGYTGGVCAGVLGILMTNHGWPWVPALVRRILLRHGRSVCRSVCWWPSWACRRSWSPWRTSWLSRASCCCRPAPVAPSPTATTRSSRS